MFDYLIKDNGISELEARNINVQSLAFVGDSVHTFFVRTKLLTTNDMKSGQLHTLANKFVKASGQSKVIDSLEYDFTEQENDVFKRARNYKTQSQAKNASSADYKRATGFEAVIGYLFVSGQKDRMLYLLQKSFDIIDNQ